jgi:hypothetical protein
VVALESQSWVRFPEGEIEQNVDGSMVYILGIVCQGLVGLGCQLQKWHICYVLASLLYSGGGLIDCPSGYRYGEVKSCDMQQ